MDIHTICGVSFFSMIKGEPSLTFDINLPKLCFAFVADITAGAIKKCSVKKYIVRLYFTSLYKIVQTLRQLFGTTITLFLPLTSLFLHVLYIYMNTPPTPTPEYASPDRRIPKFGKPVKQNAAAASAGEPAKALSNEDIGKIIDLITPYFLRLSLDEG